MSSENAHQANKLLIAKLSALLLSIPFMRMELRVHFLPARLSDLSWGMMGRLGVCFAPVVLIWSWGFRGKLFHWRSGLFFLVSVISALGGYGAGFLVPENFFMLAIVITGAILLSLAQKFLLESSWTQVLAASIMAPAFFYFVTYVARLFPYGIGNLVANYWPYYWQVGYLLGMFVIPDFFPSGAAFASAEQ